MPGCYQVTDSHRRIAIRTPARAACGLPEEGFVFCCFNNNLKITPGFFDIWMRLLGAVPESVLWLLQDNVQVESNLRREALSRGVATERIVFAPRIAMEDHLARQRLADLFLDTLPCNAHTTASDALWVGLPVLTCMGETFAGRVASSLLHTLDLPELITHSLVDYEALALDLARNPAHLRELHSRLAANRHSANLFDSECFCRHIEKAYKQMWAIWQQEDKPRAFRVE